jgi:predicted HAD superfamily Cof-like phosphohydrolase
MSYFKDVANWHEVMEQPYNGPPRGRLGGDQDVFRQKFLQEEVDEGATALEQGKFADHLDSLVDVVFVALGTAYLHGYDFDKAWDRVLHANHQKVPAPAGKWKIVKPPGWTPPDHSDLVPPHE